MDVEIAVFSCTPACLCYCWGKKLVDDIQGETLSAPRCDMSNHDRCRVMVMPSLSAIRQTTKWWHHNTRPNMVESNRSCRAFVWLRSRWLTGCKTWRRSDGVHTGEEQIWSLFWELLGNSVVANWDHLAHIQAAKRKKCCLSPAKSLLNNLCGYK